MVRLYDYKNICDTLDIPGLVAVAAYQHNPSDPQTWLDRAHIIFKFGLSPARVQGSERALMKVMQRCQKPICLFVDDAYELHGQTLRGLKQMIEKTGRRGSRLTLMLAGHPPRLTNDLRRPSHAGTGARHNGF